MSPDPGHMILYDRMLPALPADSYRIVAKTDVDVLDPGEGGDPGVRTQETLKEDRRYFDVVGPRFVLPPTELAGVFPPRNGRGPFHLTLPHAAFGRKTLPWENDLDPAGDLPAAEGTPGGAPALNGRRPSIALLLFEESEITVERGQNLESVLPASVRSAIDAPSGVVCDAIRVRRSVLLDVLPTPDEMSALTHVREVNVDDRELAAGDSDGWFSVVMSNRLPEQGRSYRACIVSLEGRADLFQRLERHLEDPPSVDIGSAAVDAVTVARLSRLARDFPDRKDLATRLRDARVALEEEDADRSPGADAVLRAVEVGTAPSDVVAGPSIGPGVMEAAAWVTADLLAPEETLVLLSSWTFECTGSGTFRSLCLDLDVGMIGEHASGVRMADTGHLAIRLQDRDGSEQSAWYRGPLAPYPVTRDTEGPYHSADQCRRVSPETGMEDVSFSSAFEVGRLLATSDGRLAQDLMRWRRTMYRAARRALSRTALAGGFDISDLLDPRLPLAPLLSSRVAERVVADLPAIDRYEMELVRRAPGLDPGELARTWRLADATEAAALLGGASLDALGLDPEITPGRDVRLGHLRNLRAVMMGAIERNGA